MNATSDLQGEISNLSDNELSDRLVEFGLMRTPVTSMTRKYLEKQLMTKIKQSQGRWEAEENIESNENSHSKNNSQRLEEIRRQDNGNFKNDSRSISACESVNLFFAVFFPNDNSDIGSRVFYEQEEALQHVKKNKKARFKAFKSYPEAMEFASHGVHMNGSLASPVSNQPSLPPIADGASRFKGPKSQDLVLLRKVIENGDIAEVKRMVWENPRYLVGSGDTPSILQEGARYNALHVAAKVMNSEMTALLLETVSDVRFIQLLYGIELEENCRQRANFLLDLYLNTPDKGQNDTPLHLAVKFGAVKVVEVLVSYPECDRHRPNKFSKTPQQIICERMKNPTKNAYEEIEQLLKDSYFVPVLRSLDLVLQPKVGETFSTKKPLITNNELLGPQLDVSAYAGPMDYEQAETFRRRWKTPPRMKTSMALRVARLNDLDRGLEREGRELAKTYNIKWREYWPFLGIFTDFNTTDGISKLDTYLKEKFEKMSLEVATKSCETPSTPTNNGPQNSKSLVLSPMSDLCVALTSCSLADTSLSSTPPSRRLPDLPTPTPTQQDPTTSLSPILYIEKTCHVLARRLSDGILHALQASEDTMCLSKNLKDVLHTEVLNMQKLINSFRSNSCFSKINFQLIHSRISMVVPYFLDDLTQSFDLMRICSSLQLLASQSAQDESSDEEEKSISSYRGRVARAAPLRLGEQVTCLAQLVIHALNRPGGRSLVLADKEPEVVAMWARCSECSCTWSASPPMTRAMRKGYSLKRNHLRNEAAGRVWSRQEAEQVVQRMPTEDDDQSETSETEECKADEDSLSVGEDTDKFYTPPSSVTSEPADIEDFDLPEEGFPVFLDGKLPTKLDVDVLRALNLELLSNDKYPNVWRWKHQLMQFTEQERECWPSPARLKRFSNGSDHSSPVSSPSCSPMYSPVTHRKPNSLQQMWGSPEPPFSSPKRRLNL